MVTEETEFCQMAIFKLKKSSFTILKNSRADDYFKQLM